MYLANYYLANYIHIYTLQIVPTFLANYHLTNFILQLCFLFSALGYEIWTHCLCSGCGPEELFLD